jgi:hypothetical protein
MKSKTKPKKDPARALPRPALVAGEGRRRVLLGLALLVAGGATWALFEFVLWNRLPSELTGKWVVVDGPADQIDTTFDFFRNGTMIGKVNRDGEQGTINARIDVKEKNMFVTTRNLAGEDATHVMVIRTLTANELVLEDEQGKIWKLSKAH